jgi:hypothetical protein
VEGSSHDLIHCTVMGFSLNEENPEIVRIACLWAKILTLISQMRNGCVMLGLK